MRKQFVTTVEKIIKEDSSVSLILGDIGVFGFRNSLKDYSDRVFNIGILEQSTISLASGLSISGFIPIVHTIAPFMVERALEQMKIDFGYQKLSGNFVSVGSSYDYAALGPTHHCPGDVQQLLTIPNFEIVIPGSSKEFDSLFKQSYNNKNPTYFRLSEYENLDSFDVNFGQALEIRRGNLCTIICVGNTLQNVLLATENLDVTVLYYTTIFPFDSETLKKFFNERIIVVEPYYEGGLNYFINKAYEGKSYRLYNIGVPHKFLINYGKKTEHDTNLGLDSEGIKKRIESCLN